MEETGLTVRESGEVGIFTPPDIVLDNAMTAAKALMKVVSLKKKPVIMNGEQYLEYEDWQTCGQFYGYTVRTGDAVLVDIDGVKGAKAHADLINMRTGEVIGGAEAYCMRDEEKWSTRPKYEWQGEGDNRTRVKVGEEIVPWFQLASMAQTRAGAKAFRNRLAWVVVLAGYKPTPAEEMTEGTVSEAVQARRTVDKTSHYCAIHDVNFFKKGKMKAFAHPIGDTGEWCHEPAEKPQSKGEYAEKPQAQSLPVAPESTPEPPKETTRSMTLKEDETPVESTLLDLEWVKESLNNLGWVGVLGWIRERMKIQAKTVREAVGKMTDEQKLQFGKEIQDRLERFLAR